jgi:hypothetical protein
MYRKYRLQITTQNVVLQTLAVLFDHFYRILLFSVRPKSMFLSVKLFWVQVKPIGMYLQPAVGKLLLESSGVTLLPLWVKENRYF